MLTTEPVLTEVAYFLRADHVDSIRCFSCSSAPPRFGWTLRLRKSSAGHERPSCGSNSRYTCVPADDYTTGLFSRVHISITFLLVIQGESWELSSEQPRRRWLRDTYQTP